MMETIIKRVGTKEDALQLTGYKESYFDKLNAAGIIPGVSKPLGKKCYYDMHILQEWLLGNQKKSLNEMQQDAATYVSHH